MGRGEAGRPWQKLPPLGCCSLPPQGSPGQQSRQTDGHAEARRRVSPCRQRPKLQWPLKPQKKDENPSSEAAPSAIFSPLSAERPAVPSHRGPWQNTLDPRRCRVGHRIPPASKPDHHCKLRRSPVCVAPSPPAYEHPALPADWHHHGSSGEGASRGQKRGQSRGKKLFPNIRPNRTAVARAGSRD